MFQSGINILRVEIEIVYTREFLEHMYNLYNSQYLTNFRNINPQLPVPAPAEISSPDYYENLLEYGTNRPPAPARNPDWDQWRSLDSASTYGMDVRNMPYFSIFSDDGDIVQTYSDITDLNIGGAGYDNTGLIITAYKNGTRRIIINMDEEVIEREEYFRNMGFNHLSIVKFDGSSKQAIMMRDIDGLFAQDGWIELVNFLDYLIEDRNSLYSDGVPVITG